MNDFDARIIEDIGTWNRDTVLLMVRRRERPFSTYLMRDGTWRAVAEGESLADPGIELPRAAIEAIVTAIGEWQGHTSHADTEARVLREWLAVERDRVDATLERGL